MPSITGNTIIFSSEDEEIKQLNAGKNELVILNYLKDKNLKSVSFNCCGLTDDALKIIMSIIKKCKHIVSLDIGNNFGLTEKGIDYLAANLPIQINELSIRHSFRQAPADAFVELCAAISKTQINKLDLGGLPLKGIASKIVAILQDSNVLDLSLSTCGLSEADALSLSEVLLGLKRLDITSNGLKDTAGVALIKAAKKCKLHAIDIGYNPFSTDFLSTLAQLAFDSTLTDIQYHGLTLPHKALQEMKIAESLNNENNTPLFLSQSYFAGYNLKILESANKKDLPAEMISSIGEKATKTRTQLNAFVTGYKVADEICRLKQKI